MKIQLKEKKSETRILPGKERSRELINLEIRKVMSGLVNGRLPWPWYLWGSPRVGKTCASLCMLDFAGGLYWTADQWAADLEEARTIGLRETVPGQVTIIPGDDGRRWRGWLRDDKDRFVMRNGSPVDAGWDFHPELKTPDKTVREQDKIRIVKPADLWGRMGLASLFVLDDCAMRSKPTEPQVLSVKRVLDDRHGKPLIVIGNYPPDALAARLGGEQIGKATSKRITEGTVTMYPDPV